MFGAELSFLKFLEGIRTDFLDSFFEKITMLGEETILVFVIAIIYLMFDKCLAGRILFITLTSLLSNCTIKNFVRRPRPFFGGKVSCVRPETATGYSFPSGHSQTFATWCISLGVFFKKKWLLITASVLAVFLGFSRMYLGAHYPSDVIVGIVLGIVFAIFGNKLYDKVQSKHLLHLSALIIMTPFAVYFLLTAQPLFEDFFKVYGMLAGFCLSMFLEEKFAPINYNCAMWKKILRVIFAVAAALLIKSLFRHDFSAVYISMIYESIKYFVLIVCVLGLYPFIIKKINL